jgi:hypothetical protein
MTQPLSGNRGGTAGATASTRSDSNPATNPNFAAPMPTRKMPKPGEKNAPTFDPDKPGELVRFFELMEDWFADEHITDDVDKKRRIVRYLDADSEVQWKALPEFTNGTFEEFKVEVISFYPGAEDLVRGSVSALKSKIKDIGPVGIHDRADLMNLIRTVTAEVVKLKLITPPIHTNKELVDLFLSGLTVDFAQRVSQKLAVRGLMNLSNPAANLVEERNSEDMFDVAEVMKIARYAAAENKNSFGRFLKKTDDTSATNVKLEAAVAKLSDSIEIQTRHNQVLEQRLASMQQAMNQSRMPVQPNYNRGVASYESIDPSRESRLFLLQWSALYRRLRGRS